MTPEQFYAEPCRGRFGVLAPETLFRMAPPMGMWAAVPVASCARCGALFGVGSMTRNKRFCSAYCRNAEYTARRRAVGDMPGAGRCRACGRSASSDRTQMCHRCRRARRDERRALMLEAWLAGETLGAIGRRLGTAAPVVNRELVRMRDEGIDVPYRRTPEQRARMAAGRWAAR